MLTVRALLAEIAATLRDHFRALLIAHLFLTVFAAAILVPITGWVLAALAPLTQVAVISTGGLLGFVLSPAGWLWLLATGTTAALLMAAQLAAMVLIPATARPGQRWRVAVIALWTVALRLPRLTALTLLQVSAHLAVSLPWVIAVAFAWDRWLAPFDPGWLMSAKPAPFWTFVVTAAICLLGFLVANAWLLLRWVLALPLVARDNLPAMTALSRSRDLTRGRRGTIARVALFTAALTLGLPALFTPVYDALATPVLARVLDHATLVAPAIGVYVVLYLLLTLALAFLGLAVHGLLLHGLYRRMVDTGPPATEPVPAHAGGMAWGAEVLLVAMAVFQGVAVLNSLETEDAVAVTAHRGSSMNAPENTLSAIELAIAEGADYIEIDVRMTADGALVLWHDPDLRRIAGDDRFVWDLTLEELRSVDVGGWFSPAFAGERAPTLEQAIERVGGRARLYVEIKPSAATPELTARVVGTLRAHDLLDTARVGSMSPSVIREVRRLAPDAATTLFAQFVLGRLDRDAIDALGLRANRVGAAQLAVARAYGHELHVWTVNDPVEMARMADLGVDNIITDRPDVLAALLAERAAMAPADRWLQRLRGWLRR